MWPQDALHRLRVAASLPPVVDHSTPRRPEIPADRRVEAIETFLSADGVNVFRGQIHDIESPIVQANKRYFQKPAQPLEAA